MVKTFRLACFLQLLLLVSCGSSPSVVVGSKAGAEQTLLGEIIAQHLEKRLGIEVQRRLGFGDTPILYQSLLGGEMTLYPDTTGILVSEILKEKPAADPAVTLERARAELARTAMLEVMKPLGFDNRNVVVVRAEGAEGINTLSEAAQATEGWKLGVSYEFQSRSEGLPVLNSYRLPMAAAFRSMDAAQLFPALEQGSVSMIVAQDADGYLVSSQWKILEDDHAVFSPQQAVIVVRQNAFASQPKLKDALAELSGKLDLQTIRKLNAQVVVDERPPADVAREFLTSAGL